MSPTKQHTKAQGGPQPAPEDTPAPAPAEEGHEGEEGHEEAPVQPAGGGEVATITQSQLVAWLNGDDITEEDASDELDYAMALKILTAESSEAVLAKDSVVKFADCEDVPVTVLDLAWRKSTKSEDGKGRYAVMHCVDAAGMPFITSCGATKVVLQLRKAQLEGWLPWAVELAISQTSNGRTVYELVAPSEPF